MLSQLVRAETATWRAATQAARDSGLLFMANPMHCVSGGGRIMVNFQESSMLSLRKTKPGFGLDLVEAPEGAGPGAKEVAVRVENAGDLRIGCPCL